MIGGRDVSKGRQARSGELFLIAWALLLAALVNIWTASHDDGLIRLFGLIMCVICLLVSVRAYTLAKLVHRQEKEKS